MAPYLHARWQDDPDDAVSMSERAVRRQRHWIWSTLHRPPEGGTLALDLFRLVGFVPVIERSEVPIAISVARIGAVAD